MWNISSRLTITTAILYLPTPSHWTIEYVEHSIWRVHNEDKNISPTLHDELKLTAKSEEDLQKQIQTVKTFSDYVHMEFWLDKCAKITFKEAN